MYIKYDYIGERTLLYLPPGQHWSLQYRMFTDDGCGDFSVYLTADGIDPITVLDADLFCQGTPDLPCHVVGHLYEELIDTVAKGLANNPNAIFVDIPILVHQLVDTKYRDLWIQKGYIPAQWQMYD